jgi:lactoylglutathione lyase
MGLIYFGIRVTDLDRSLDFYIRGLGLEELRRGGLPHGGRRVLLVDRGTAQRLELNWYPKESPYAVPYVAGEGLDHLGYSTGHAADMARRLVEHGGRVVLTPTDPLGVRQNFYVEDPDGNWIELMGWGATRPSRRAKTAPRAPPSFRRRARSSGSVIQRARATSRGRGRGPGRWRAQRPRATGTPHGKKRP